MKTRHALLAALLAATVSGCATADLPAAKNIAIEQSVCCTDYSQFGWIPLTGDQLDIAIDAHSPVADIEGGKSYFAAFAMPENINRLQITLNSWMSSEGVFAPKILLLDPAFKPVKTVSLDAFSQKNSDMFHLASYETQFVMDREQTPYLVVYSPEEYRRGEITIPHPERIRAEELGMARPMVTDPVIQHSNFGSLELALKPLSLRAYRVDEVKAKPLAEKAPQEVAAKTTTESMMAESEVFYNQKITQAVESGDIALALKWLEEAKRAGSKSAEATFINLVSQ
ncbi:MalM family protein [Enterovibrio paralichthyis]|uniref:MalM family protein n=1 Tax=Enterovibrio paralichthyis TaxID=2853805 RepID=UPI001C494BE3|nr:MalM family protein [Enterovibrio paralichthyis]MBV7299165.1 transcriptional regulator [Enterovibrio paralichthyis]